MPREGSGDGRDLAGGQMGGTEGGPGGALEPPWPGPAGSVASDRAEDCGCLRPEVSAQGPARETTAGAEEGPARGTQTPGFGAVLTSGLRERLPRFPLGGCGDLDGR